MTELPLHIQDQIGAATQDASRTFFITTAIMDMRGQVDGGIQQLDPASEEQIRQAVQSCRVCPHLNNSNPQPAFCILGQRVIVCGDCLPQALDKYINETGKNQNCDVCLQLEKNNQFSEFQIQRGPLLIFGNRGRCCPLGHA